MLTLCSRESTKRYSFSTGHRVDAKQTAMAGGRRGGGRGGGDRRSKQRRRGRGRKQEGRRGVGGDGRYGRFSRLEPGALARAGPGPGGGFGWWVFRHACRGCIKVCTRARVWDLVLLLFVQTFGNPPYDPRGWGDSGEFARPRMLMPKEHNCPPLEPYLGLRLQQSTQTVATWLLGTTHPFNGVGE